MKYTLSVLDLTAEEVKKVIDRELGGIYDTRFAPSYGSPNLSSLQGIEERKL